MSLIKEKTVIQTLRQPRIFKLAIFDLLLAVVAMAFIFHRLGYSPYTGIALTIPVGIIVHYILGINTQLNYQLGISEQPDKN